MTRRSQGPYPGPAFAKQVNEVSELSLVGIMSGEMKVNAGETPLGAAKVDGRIVDVWLSVEGSGKDDSNTLSFTVDVMINGTSCLTTKPIIAHVSGEAATNKTTKETGDTGITQAVIDPDANDYVVGDMFTYTRTLTRTASPTTEMKNAVLVVELEPNN